MVVGFVGEAFGDCAVHVALWEQGSLGLSLSVWLSAAPFLSAGRETALPIALEFEVGCVGFAICTEGAIAKLCEYISEVLSEGMRVLTW